MILSPAPPAANLKFLNSLKHGSDARIVNQRLEFTWRSRKHGNKNAGGAVTKERVSIRTKIVRSRVKIPAVSKGVSPPFGEISGGSLTLRETKFPRSRGVAVCSPGSPLPRGFPNGGGGGPSIVAHTEQVYFDARAPGCAAGRLHAICKCVG